MPFLGSEGPRWTGTKQELHWMRILWMEWSVCLGCSETLEQPNGRNSMKIFPWLFTFNRVLIERFFVSPWDSQKIVTANWVVNVCLKRKKNLFIPTPQVALLFVWGVYKLQANSDGRKDGFANLWHHPNILCRHGTRTVWANSAARPSSITSTRSLSRMVLSRWAMVMVVAAANSVRIVFCRMASVGGIPPTVQCCAVWSVDYQFAAKGFRPWNDPSKLSMII